MNNQNNFTREDIAESLHTDFGLTKKDCLIFVNDIIDIIIEGLKTSGYVKIHNFGSFKVTRKKTRIGRNPKTMEEVMISERNVLKFKPSKIISSINKTKIQECTLYFEFSFREREPFDSSAIKDIKESVIMLI